MKKTSHRTNEREVLMFLNQNGQVSADQIGAHFWPDKTGYGPSRGGPGSHAVAAAWMLGKMRRKGLVFQNRHGQWEVTEAGRQAITIEQVLPDAPMLPDSQSGNRGSTPLGGIWVET